jgi:hypothetical protein
VGNYQTARVNARLQLNVTDICLARGRFRFSTFFLDFHRAKS